MFWESMQHPYHQTSCFHVSRNSPQLLFEPADPACFDIAVLQTTTFWPVVMSQWVDPEAPPPSYQPKGGSGCDQPDSYLPDQNNDPPPNHIYHTTSTPDRGVIRDVGSDSGGDLSLGCCMGCMCAACCCGCIVM